MTYYTLRKAGNPEKPVFELAKWESGYPCPIDVYTQWIPQRRDGSYHVHSCNCPSRSNPCKHAEMSERLLNDNSIYELPMLYWEDGEVKLAPDLPSKAQLTSLFEDKRFDT